MSKNFFFLFLLGTLMACNEMPRRQHSSCKSLQGLSVTCSEEALTAAEFRKKYIADVDAPIEIGQTKFLFTGSDSAEDVDQDYSCSLEVKEGTQFTYTLKDNSLVLKHGL